MTQNGEGGTERGKERRKSGERRLLIRKAKGRWGRDYREESREEGR